MPNRPPRAVLYVRVSTERQAQHGTSLFSQLEECRKKAVQIGAEIMASFQDEGVSGGLFATRAGIQDALRFIEEGRADTLVAFDITRLSRDREHQAIIDKRLNAVGARLEFCSQSFDASPEGELAKGIMGDFAAYERQKIKERTSKGRRRRAEEGSQPIRNFSPFGYHIVTQADVLSGQYPHSTLGSYQIVGEQAQWMRQIFEQFVGGASLRRVCQYLQKSGVATPRNGQYWRADVVKKMIENPVYKGQPVFGRRENRTDEGRVAQGMKALMTRQAPEEKWVQLSCEAIVTEQVWEAANQRLKESRALFGGNPNNKYTLTGLIRCPLCRRGMRAQRWTNKTPNANGSLESHSYHCFEAYGSRNSAGKVCNNHKYLGSKMDQLTCNAVLEAAKRPESIEAAMMACYQSQDSGDAEEKAAQLKRELKKLEAREKATVQAQIQGIEAGASTFAYSEIFRSILSQRTRLQEQLQETEKRSSGESKVKIKGVAAMIKDSLQQVEEALFAPEITPAERHNLLALIVKEVVPHEDGALVYLRSPIAGAESTVANVPALAK